MSSLVLLQVRQDGQVHKIPTLFMRDPEDMRHVTREVNPPAVWVLAGEGVATRKYDGTCLMLDDDGQWWARREVKPGKAQPAGWVSVEHDEATGKSVGWEPIEQSPFVKFWQEALRNPYQRRHVGTYELVGPKINGNPEQTDRHELIWHNDAEVLVDAPRTYDDLAAWLTACPYEGIVWHHPDGRMAKLKRRDFGRA
jgi:hypothetical protein